MSEHDTPTLSEEAEAFQGKPAGIVSRSFAAAIDALVVTVVILAGYVAASAVAFAWNPRSFSFPAPSGWFTVAAAIGVATVYLTAGWWIAGRTYGCAIMGLRVVGREDRHLRFMPALLRAAMCVLFPLGLAWCALDRRARAAHDIVTASRVIYDWRHQER